MRSRTKQIHLCHFYCDTIHSGVMMLATYTTPPVPHLTIFIQYAVSSVVHVVQISFSVRFISAVEWAIVAVERPRAVVVRAENSNRNRKRKPISLALFQDRPRPPDHHWAWHCQASDAPMSEINLLKRNCNDVAL